jgi:hypothetical protein
MLALRPPTLVMPAVNAPGVEALLEAFRHLDTSTLPCTLRPAQVKPTLDRTEEMPLWSQSDFPELRLAPDGCGQGATR